jgi:glyoxylase-like metal-dependent hydrolase (beta-lactamase superfamily II)
MSRVSLPPSVHVFIRDWLSANNVLLKSGRDGNVLVDSGYIRHAPLTLALIASAQGIGGEPLARLVNTHGHSDHIGGNAAIRARYGCPIAVPKAEAAAFAAWDEKALLLAYCGQRADRFPVDETIGDGETRIWGDLEWRAIAAPGHDMGALVFYNAEHGILISGDALWQNGYGLVMPPEVDAQALPAARATLEMIAALDAQIVIPGHGEPFAAAEVDAALERAFQRTAAFEADSVRIARHALKALLVFNLLDVQRLPLAGVTAFVRDTEVFREFNALFFRLEPQALAALLMRELERAGAVRIEGGVVRPG